MTRQKGERQSGAVMFFLAISIVVLITFVAVMVTLALHSANRSQLQNISNLAALGAIEEAVRETGSNDYLVRAEAVKDRAEFLIRANRLLGVPDFVLQGDLGFSNNQGPGGVIRFGIWYPEPPPPPHDPCGGSYPCFIEHSEPPTGGVDFPSTNAVRIEFKTQAPVTGVFDSFLNSAGVTMQVESTGAVVPRCSVMLLDASLSTTADSHPYRIDPPVTPQVAYEGKYKVATWDAPLPPGHCLEGTLARYPPLYVLCPRNLALFAYNDWISYERPPPNGIFRDLVDQNPSASNPCKKPPPPPPNPPWPAYIYTTQLDGESAKEGHIWCNMQWQTLNGGNLQRRQIQTLRGDIQNWDSCYEYENTPYGKMLIDKCFDPEPLTSFYLGFHAGLKLLETQKTAADRARLSVFRGTADVNPFPQSGGRFTNDFQAFLQLTNVKNRGTKYRPVSEGDTPATHPNMVDFGWFPIYPRGNQGEAGTNIVQALLSAINDLSNPNECPSSAQKSIIIATDGVASCAPGFNPECADSYDRFLGSEERLLLDTIHGPSILSILKEQKIALTVLLAGRDVRPNIVDRKDQSGNFLTYAEAVSLGYRGLSDKGGSFNGNPYTEPNLIIDSRGICNGVECTDANAWPLAGVSPNSFFQRPNGVMGHMAIESGGIFCPLLPRGDLTPAGQALGTAYVEQYWYEDHDSNPDTPRRLREFSVGPNDNGTVLRRDGEPLYMNPEFLTTGETAADCVRRTLGANPFLLVKE